jgi:integrase
MKLIKGDSSGDTWKAEVTTENGSRLLVDTHCKTKKEAEKVISDAKLKELEAAAKAHRLTAEVVTLITANRKITVADAIREWDAWMKGSSRADRTRVNNLETVGHWVREMGINDKSVGAITTQDIDPWVNTTSTPIKRGSRLMRLSAIKNFMQFCSIRRYILANPSGEVSVNMKHLSHDQREIRHKPVFSDDEIAFLIAKSDEAEPPSLTPGFFRAAIILGRDLALRLGDICNLEWSNFDLPRKVVSLWMDKTNARIEIPMSPRVIRLFSSLKESDKQFLFPNEREIANDPKQRSKLSVAIGRFMERVGFNGYSFHCLRASYATTMANQGMTVDQIAERLGHASPTTTKVYIRKDGAAKVNAR